MDSLTCKECKQRSSHSSVTPSTQHIRCHGCKRGLSVGNTYNGKSSRTSKDWSLELEKKKTEAKILCQSLRKKFSGSNPQRSQTGSPPPSIITADPPPRGKRAFLCGVTYKKQKCELKGTAQDVKNIRDLLVQVYGFPSKSILILAGNSHFFDRINHEISKLKEHTSTLRILKIC